MKFAARTISLILLLALAACSNGKIPLEYNFEEGDGTRYRWTIDSETEVNSSSEESITTTNMIVDVHEKVSQNKGEDPVLSITLQPTRLRQGNRAMNIPKPMTVKYQLNKQGEIVEPVTEELAPQAASAIQLGATLIRSRIALPADPVGIGDEWDAPFVLDGDLGNIKLDGHGKLLGFELKGKRKLARIETVRTGNIVTHEQQGGVPVQLRGTSTTNALSSLDVDKGVLYSTSARLVSDFDIASQESGKLIGTMRVTLNSKLELAKPA